MFSRPSLCWCVGWRPWRRLPQFWAASAAGSSSWACSSCCRRWSETKWNEVKRSEFHWNSIGIPSNWFKIQLRMNWEWVENGWWTQTLTSTWVFEALELSLAPLDQALRPGFQDSNDFEWLRLWKELKEKRRNHIENEGKRMENPSRGGSAPFRLWDPSECFCSSSMATTRGSSRTFLLAMIYIVLHCFTSFYLRIYLSHHIISVLL